MLTSLTLPTTLTREDVLRALRSRQGDDTLRALATALGCSPAYLSDIYRGRREPGPKVLRALGLERQTRVTTTYRRKGERT